MNEVFKLSITKIYFVLIPILVMFGWLAGGFSGRQPSTVALDVSFSLGRLSLMGLALFWLQELLARPIEHKFISQRLALPRQRYHYLLSVWAKISLSLLVVSAVYFLFVFIMVKYGNDYSQATPVALGGQYIVQCVLILLSILIVTAFAVVICTISTTPYMAFLSGCGFYLIGHSLAPVIAYLELTASADPTQKNYILPLLDVMSYLIPDLTLFDLREWSMYGHGYDLYLAGKTALLAVAYIGVCLLVSAFLFNKREFS